MFSTPTVVGDLLFIGSCAGTFYAINKTTGHVRWSYDIRKDGKQQSFHGDPLVVDDLILIGTDQSCEPDGIGHVYAFERDSGKVRWKYRSTSVPTDIVPLGSNIFFGSFQDKWSSVNFQSRALNWSFSTNTPNNDCEAIKSPVGIKNSLFFTGLDGVIYSLNAKTGKVAWKRKLAASPSTSLAFRDQTLYVGAADNRIYRLDAGTGAVLTELAVEATPVGRLAFAGDSVFLFLENRSTRTGYILSVDPKLADVRWRQQSSPDWPHNAPTYGKDSSLPGTAAARWPVGARASGPSVSSPHVSKGNATVPQAEAHLADAEAAPLDPNVALTHVRATDTAAAAQTYRVIGQPEDLDGARELALTDRYGFQWWICPLIGARALGAEKGQKEGKKGADRGIDGIIVFTDDNSNKAKRVIVSVKSGHVNVAHIRDLAHVMKRENAAIGVYLTLEPPTKPMLTEAAECGFYHSPGWNKDYPRLQILTVEEILDGKTVDLPPNLDTYKQAQKIVAASDDQYTLGFE